MGGVLAVNLSAQNSGSHNTEGLEAMRALLRERASRLGATITDRTLTAGEYITPAGEKNTVSYAPALEITKRPDAPVQIVLTGHYDTVFPKDFHFQTPVYLDDDTVNGPGTADMKGGILVMMTALEALEKSPHAENIGYTVLLSPDEEIGSPGSAKRLMELGKNLNLQLGALMCASKMMATTSGYWASLRNLQR